MLAEKKPEDKYKRSYGWSYFLLVFIVVWLIGFRWFSVLTKIHLIPFFYICLGLIGVILYLKACFEIVPEGYGIDVMVIGSFLKFNIVWRSHEVDEETNDVEDSPGFRRKWRGLMWVGPPPFYKVFKYHQMWQHFHSNGEIVAHDERLIHIRVSPDTYAIEFSLEDKDPVKDLNGVPLGIVVSIPMRIVNGFEAFFGAENWLAMIHIMLKPILRTFFGSCRYLEDIIDMRAGKGIEEAQKEQGIIDSTGASVFKTGVDLREEFRKEIKRQLTGKSNVKPFNGGLQVQGAFVDIEKIDVYRVVPDPQYLALTTAQYEAEQKGKAKVIMAKAAAESEKERGKGIADGSVERTEGANIKALMKRYGKSEAEIQADLAAGKYKDELPSITEEVRIRQAMDTHSFGQLNLPGVEGVLVEALQGVASKFIKPTNSPNEAIPSYAGEEGSGGGGSSGDSGTGSKSKKDPSEEEWLRTRERIKRQRPAREGWVSKDEEDEEEEEET